MVKIAAHAVGFSVLTLLTQTGVLAYLAAGRAMSGRSRKGPARLAATMLALAAAYTGPWAVSAALASRFGRTPLRCLVSAKSQLARRWGVRSDIIRFQGCRAARHDDRVHIRSGPDRPGRPRRTYRPANRIYLCQSIYSGVRRM